MSVTPNAFVEIPTPEEEERARARVGGDQASRLSWLLDFAHRPAEQIRSMDYMSLCLLNAEVREFAKGLGQAFGSPHPRQTDRVRDELCLLAEFANTSVYEFLRTGTVSFAPYSLQKPDEPAWEKRVERRGAKVVGYYAGPQRQMFVMQCSAAFEAEAARISKCASVGCGRVFVQRKRGLYCSGRCSLRERMRRYRKKLSKQDRYEIRHVRYVKDSEHVVRPQGPRRSK
jgi:hypothetical protein